jgi:hypothetical protein
MKKVMKKKIRLRDITKEQLKEWVNANCDSFTCDDCIFGSVRCSFGEARGWFNHKDLYSDKFLDQEIEIDVPDILTKEEHDYLEAVIKPWKNDVKTISKHITFDKELEFICIALTSQSFRPIFLRYFKRREIYKGMKADKEYSLEDPGL